MQARKGTTDTLLLNKVFPSLAHADQYQKDQVEKGDEDGFFSSPPPL